MAFKVIQIEVKVAEPLNLRKWLLSKFISFAISVAGLNLNIAYDIIGQYLNFIESNFKFLPRASKVSIFCDVRPSVRPSVRVSVHNQTQRSHNSEFSYFV